MSCNYVAHAYGSGVIFDPQIIRIEAHIMQSYPGGYATAPQASLTAALLVLLHLPIILIQTHIILLRIHYTPSKNHIPVCRK